MAKVVKRKLRIKKKNFTIFVSSILLIIILVISGINKATKTISPKEEKHKSKKTGIVKEQKPNFYKKENEKRYKKYKEENPSLTEEQIIINVNIGLDYDYYENTKESIYLNKSFILVNKYNYLEEDYVPDNLEKLDERYSRSDMKLVSYAKDAFQELAEDAKKEDMTIIAMSTYRSYKYQKNLYNRYKKEDGIETADTYSARAGYSEHQTGLAVDVYNGKEDYTNFEKTKEFRWMQENAYKYGFILRFPKEKTKETGYQYESWHYRYVGKKIATYIHENNISFEEYYVTKIEK